MDMSRVGVAVNLVRHPGLNMRAPVSQQADGRIAPRFEVVESYRTTRVRIKVKSQARDPIIRFCPFIR